MKLLLTIISTQKYFDTRVKYIKDSWLKDFENFLILSDHEDKENNIVKISEDNSYESAVEKNVKSFRYIYENYSNFDWFINVDDDTFVNYKNLLNYIYELPIDRVIKIGHLNINTAGYGINYHSGGAGTLFNMRALEILKNITNTDKYYYYRNSDGTYSADQTPFADANVGIFCDHNSIEQIDSPLFTPEKPQYFGYSEEEIKKRITFHYIYGQEQVNLYNLVKS